MSIRNIPVYLVDTAGIRETSDKVEKMGIEKSKEAFNQCGFYYASILDGSQATGRKKTCRSWNFIRERKSLVIDK